MFKTAPFVKLFQLCRQLGDHDVLYSEYGERSYFIIVKRDGGYALDAFTEKKDYHRQGRKTQSSWFNSAKELQETIQLNPEFYAINHATGKVDPKYIDRWENFLKSFSHRVLIQYNSPVVGGVPTFKFVPVESVMDQPDQNKES